MSTSGRGCCRAYCSRPELQGSSFPVPSLLLGSQLIIRWFVSVSICSNFSLFMALYVLYTLLLSFFFFDGRASPFHGSLIHFVGLWLPCQVFSFVVLIGLKSIVRCCTCASRVHLNHLLCFISMAPRPNSSSGNDILPSHIFPVLLIGFSSLFFSQF